MTRSEKPTKASPADAGQHSDIVGLPKSVLVAEDEHLVAMGLCAQLAAMGCKVIGPVGDGRAAVHACELHAPECALLDIRMPVMDGLDAAKSIWASFSIPTVLITAYSDPSYVERAQQTGVFGYILKPTTSDALRTSLAVGWARASSSVNAERRVQQLETLLTNRRLIEQAKWKLVESKKMTEPEAHTFLQTEARNHRRRLIDVACDILGVAVPGGPGTGNGAEK
ncbi:MAG: ANTAR domain-containing response regulator [Phycisphaerales bacterium]